MSVEDVFTQLPLWAFFPGTIVMSLLAIEAGFRWGRYQHQHKEPGQDAPVGRMIGAMLGLLALMLAFTVGRLSSREPTGDGRSPAKHE